MKIPYNPSFKGNAQMLRKNMTTEEKHLWYDFLKLLPLTVNRQKTIENYIVDFYIHEANIVIEIDGIQHKQKDALIADKTRDSNLNALGIKVLRYSNEDINKRFNTVCNDILKHLGINASDILGFVRTR